MDISIIIINYNAFDVTSNCIQSILDFTSGVEYEIILVDNASTECDPGKFLERFSGVVLIKSHKNGGFAYGNNLGMKNSSGEFILLLNNDTILKDDSVSKSLEFLRQHQTAGVTGCRMIYPDNVVQHTARKFRSIRWELLDLFRFIPLLMSYEKRSRLMLGKYFRCDENVECDWVNGAFFMFPREILQQLPGKKLDDRFFMYGEDQLWCLQVRKLGYQILFYGGTTLIHIGSASTDVKKQLALRKIMMRHELEIMRIRKGKGLYYFCFAIIYCLKDGIRNFFKRIIFSVRGKMIR